MKITERLNEEVGLKPCTCGGTVVTLLESPHSEGSTWIKYSISCKSCPRNIYGAQDFEHAKQIWNNRPIEDELHKAIETLELHNIELRGALDAAQRIQLHPGDILVVKIHPGTGHGKRMDMVNYITERVRDAGKDNQIIVVPDDVLFEVIGER